MIFDPHAPAPIINGYEIEEALTHGKRVRILFTGGMAPEWVTWEPKDWEMGWVRRMIQAGHRGVTLVGYVVE